MGNIPVVPVKTLQQDHPELFDVTAKSQVEAAQPDVPLIPSTKKNSSN